jgi:ATP-dependent Clp protease ATP-binding subunit ClpX
LDEDALVRILTEPKDCLVKQYVKLLEMDDVKLEFEEDAVRAIARRAIELKTGARGLRSIMEDCMLDTMFEAPSDKNIETIVVTKDAISKKAKPRVIRKTGDENIA